MRLTKHFIDRWCDRVKKPVPDSSEVEAMINDAVCLQRCRDFFTPRGIKVKILGLYWVPHENVVLKIDDKNNMAVTVLTPDMTDDGVA